MPMVKDVPDAHHTVEQMHYVAAESAQRLWQQRMVPAGKAIVLCFASLTGDWQSKTLQYKPMYVTRTDRSDNTGRTPLYTEHHHQTATRRSAAREGSLGLPARTENVKMRPPVGPGRCWSPKSQPVPNGNLAAGVHGDGVNSSPGTSGRTSVSAVAKERRAVTEPRTG
ncbi:hypothetical protein ZHAS_00008972 [Anopheles sinensis]|uniref:Uncharacterized protein n=1 Tax=Anopheles sinensis TaxID=74873 RepID=A0A084VTU5_ANOSI|nr:hypothetical protein ZHAS_00008972 [Anopheles sinensis]